MKRFIHDGPVTPSRSRYSSRTPRDEHGADVQRTAKPVRARGERMGFKNRLNLIVGLGETVLGAAAAIGTSVAVGLEMATNIDFSARTDAELVVGALASLAAISDGYHRVNRINTTSDPS